MSVAESQATAPKPKLRWYQYSLRSLLLAVSVGGPCIGWLGIVVKDRLYPRSPAGRLIQARLTDRDDWTPYLGQRVMLLDCTYDGYCDGLGWIRCGKFALKVIRFPESEPPKWKKGIVIIGVLRHPGDIIDIEEWQ